MMIPPEGIGHHTSVRFLNHLLSKNMIWDLQKHKNNIAVEENGKSYTYDDLYLFSEEFAGAVHGRSLIFILTTNTMGSLAGYISSLNHGIVPLMLDEKIGRDLLTDLIHQYRPEFLWVPESDAGDFDSCECILDRYGYSLLKTNEPDPYPLSDDLALLINTSGSIGSPKLVRQTYQNILSNAGSIIEYLEIDEHEKAITSLPMNYVYGLSVINSHLMAGASIVMTELNCYTSGFWKLFNEKSVTSFSGVPFMYEMLYKLKLTKKPVPSLKTMTQAGGKLSPELQQFFSAYAHENGKRFFVMYGASEATSRMGYLPDADALRKPGSMGIAIPGGRFELIDENNEVIKESGIKGELVYYGPNVMQGYAYCGEDLRKGDELHGRLETGDIAYRDDEGYYYICGRKSRFIKMLGKRLSLDETELLLKKQFNSVGIACAGSDDMLKVFVTEADLQEPVFDYLVNSIHINRALCKVLTIEEFPRNASGKVRYSKLNEIG